LPPQSDLFFNFELFPTDLWFLLPTHGAANSHIAHSYGHEHLIRVSERLLSDAAMQKGEALLEITGLVKINLIY